MYVGIKALKVVAQHFILIFICISEGFFKHIGGVQADTIYNNVQNACKFNYITYYKTPLLNTVCYTLIDWCIEFKCCFSLFKNL